MAIQFDKKQHADSWYTLTYQSNNELNDAAHHEIKIMIAKILVEKIKIKEIYTHIHGNLIFSISPTNVLTKFDDIIKELRIPITTHIHKLLFSLTLVGLDTSTPPKRFMYIEGSEDMDAKFKKLIEGFYPVKLS